MKIIIRAPRCSCRSPLHWAAYLHYKSGWCHCRVYSKRGEFIKREAQGEWEIGERENDIVIINNLGNWDLPWSCCSFAPRRKAHPNQPEAGGDTAQSPRDFHGNYCTNGPFFMEQGFLTPPGCREVLLAPSCQAGGVRKRQHEGKGMRFPLFCSFPFPPASSSIRCFFPPETPQAAAPAPAPSTKALQHSWWLSVFPSMQWNQEQQLRFTQRIAEHLGPICKRLLSYSTPTILPQHQQHLHCHCGFLDAHLPVVAKKGGILGWEPPMMMAAPAQTPHLFFHCHILNTERWTPPVPMPVFPKWEAGGILGVGLQTSQVVCLHFIHTIII